MSTFAEIFKSLRIKRRLTQEELAQQLGVSRSTISMYERGERFPDYSGTQELADFFRVSTDYLLGRSADEYVVYDQDERMFYFYFGDDERLESEFKSIIARLNDDGKKELVKYAKLLAASDEYKKEED